MDPLGRSVRHRGVQSARRRLGPRLLEARSYPKSWKREAYPVMVLGIISLILITLREPSYHVPRRCKREVQVADWGNISYHANRDHNSNLYYSSKGIIPYPEKEPFVCIMAMKVMEKIYLIFLLYRCRPAGRWRTGDSIEVQYNIPSDPYPQVNHDKLPQCNVKIGKHSRRASDALLTIYLPFLIATRPSPFFLV